MTDATSSTGRARPVVLYACVHNSGRSVAAACLTRRYAGDRVDVRSAGSEPGTGVDPAVAEVLAERGLSADGHVPALLTPDGVAEADVVVTMDCGQACPVLPGKRYDDWKLEDPKGKDLETVRRIVDDVDVHVRELLAGLRIDVPAAS